MWQTEIAQMAFVLVLTNFLLNVAVWTRDSMVIRVRLAVLTHKNVVFVKNYKVCYR